MALGFFSSNANDTLTDPDAILAKRKMLQQMWKESLSTQPVQHWTQGAARLVNSLANRYEENNLNEADKAGNSALSAALMGMLGGQSTGGAPVPSSGGTPVAPVAPGASANADLGSQGAPSPDASGVFARMLKQESGNRQFDKSGNTITSPAGALGIAQIMPGTAPEAARLAGLPYDPNRLRTDAEYNKALGLAYFKAQQQKFGDPYAAAAAYNAGPGAVNKAIARQDATGQPFTDFLPKETQNYMAQVGAGQGGAQQPIVPPTGQPGPVSGLAMAPTNIPPRPDGTIPGQQAIAQAMPPQGQPAPQAAPAPAAAPQSGINPAIAQILSNPGMAKRFQQNPIAMALLMQKINGTKATYQTLPDGTIIQLDPTGRTPPRPVYQGAEKGVVIPPGGTLASATTGKVIASGAPKDDRTGSQKDYEAAKKEGFKGTFFDYKAQLARAGSANPDSAFNVANAKNMAEAYKGVMDEGQQAKSDIASIKVLRQSMESLPGGATMGLRAAIVRAGIKVDPKASDIEAVDAMLNRLTPQQRQGMPGAASDRDVAMFRGALPQLTSTPQGRKTIMDTMEGLAQYKAARGQIAMQVQIGKMTPQEGLLAMEKLPDPFENFRKMQGAPGQPSPQPTGQPGAGKVGVYNPATGKIEYQ